MGFFDRLMGKKEAPKTEKKLPPAMPEQASALIRDSEGRAALRPDTQYVTTEEASAFIAERFKRLKDEIDDIQKSGLPEGDKRKLFKQNEEEGNRLGAFRRAVDARSKEPSAREQIYRDQKILIENPYFGQKVETARPEEKERTESREEAMEHLEELNERLADLMHSRDVLTKKRDELMKGIKETVSTPKEWQVSGLKHQAEDLQRPAIYPEYFPPDTKANRTAEEMKKKAEKLETESRGARKSMSEPLREALDELDDVQEEMSRVKRDIQFIKRKYGTGAERQAA